MRPAGLQPTIAVMPANHNIEFARFRRERNEQFEEQSRDPRLSHF